MKRIKKHQRSMLEGPLLSGVITYTIPIILTSVLQLLFNAADLVVVGRFCGSVSVGAVGATGSLTALLVNLFVGLSVGVGVTVAHGIGSCDENQISEAVHTAVPMALIGGVILTAAGVLLSEPMLILMNTPENTLPLSVIYVKIYFWGITFTVVYNFCAAILRAAGDNGFPHECGGCRIGNHHFSRYCGGAGCARFDEANRRLLSAAAQNAHPQASAEEDYPHRSAGRYSVFLVLDFQCDDPVFRQFFW